MRRFATILTLAACVVLLALPASVTADSSSGVPLYSNQEFGGPVHIPPGDNGVTWTRDKGTVLNLVSEGHQSDGGQTGLFIFSRVTDANPVGFVDTTGSSVFQYVNGSGNTWSAAYHGETHIGQDWYNQLAPPNPNAHGTSIVYNAEVSKWAPHATAIGANIQATQQQTNPGTPMTPYPPDIGVNIQGQWRTGIDLHGNSITHAGAIDATSLTVAGKPITGQPATTATPPPPRPVARPVGRVYLAPGVYIDYQHGHVRIVKHGQVVARF